jgi:hypothetical protein
MRMTERKRTVLSQALNGLIVCTLITTACNLPLQTAHADQTPKTQQSEYEKLSKIYAKSCADSPNKSLSKIAEKQCYALNQRLYRLSLEQQNIEKVTQPEELRKIAQTLRSRYLQVFRHNQDLNVANLIASKKNRALAAQACPSRTQATTPESIVNHSAGVDVTPRVGEQNSAGQVGEAKNNLQSDSPSLMRFEDALGTKPSEPQLMNYNGQAIQ